MPYRYGLPLWSEDLTIAAKGIVESAVASTIINPGVDPEPDFTYWQYTLPDGRVLEEAIETELPTKWDNGESCYLAFMALRDVRTGEWVEESLWGESARERC